MTQNMSPPMFNLVPESAPFSEEQRAWLNGFLAGFIPLDGATPVTNEQVAALMAGGPGGATEEDDGGAPWHDQTMPIDDRMTLAKGKSVRWKLMAAMAQQDCGQCGYDCRNYSGAIFEGKEERLNLCVPGGKATARMLKALHEEIGVTLAKPAAATVASTVEAKAPVPDAPAGTRDNPVTATLVSRTRLNKEGSEKETWHVEYDIAVSGLDYAVGDSFGLFPVNDPELVRDILAALGGEANFPIGDRTLREVLLDGVSLSPAPDMLFQLYSYITGGERRRKAQALANGEDPDGDAETLDVLAAIEKFPGVRPDPEAFIEALDPLQPRLYSISSSPKAHPGRIALTVDAVRYTIGERQRLGVASTFVGGRAPLGHTARVYIQKAHAFGLPADPATPIIMVGPGTGVAPFRAFLYERQSTQAPGRNWLFFGHQRSNCDFFYEEQFKAMKQRGVLTRLSLAWSRDGDQKVYVQDRMREVGRDLWAWLAEGAHVYVCGDAQRMAKDVELALVDIVAQHGARTPEQAVAFVTELKRQDRYQQDVY